MFQMSMPSLSHKLTVPVSQHKQLFNGDLWPEGVRVRPYYSKSANSDRDNID